MEFVLENKWIFLVIAEAVFWICLITFLVLRYWFNLNKLSMLFVAIFIINDLWIAAMAFMDYMNTGKFSSYQIIIMVIIIYAMTFGKSDFKKLDFYIKRKVAQLKGETLTSLNPPKQYYGLEYAILEWKQFLFHFVIFGIVHGMLFFIFGISKDIGEIASINQLFTLWFDKNNGQIPFDNTSANNFSRIWLLVLTIDFVITLSYSIFPKKPVSS
ncbi:hypothetical protein [Rummeliibacillus suwonensis]|uniref:hypothetical protein n=1 Tax=Rummeliibacillus suwonensis TaxID=1306154 RepID=UPI001AAE1DEF|nr:hypothetical protein [Rummeliibacillus suwonensis]MBO2535967.1 hypothetical protein [Rummeliibacillus suwonensis]